MLSIVGRSETYIGFEGPPELKRRVLEIRKAADRSMAKIMRTFVELGIREYEERGPSIFDSPVTKKEKKGTDNK